jgi:cysteine-S-conjugate beta-lyase
VIERRHTDSLKWSRYADDVLPLWVADMDFRSPEPVLEALQRRVEHGVFGYGAELEELKEAVCDRMDRLQNWKVTPEMVLYLPGLVCGLNVMCRAVGRDGDAVMINTPVYPPFLSAPRNQGRELQAVELEATLRKGRLEYPLDPNALEHRVTDQTRLFILCNPHNPTGRAYRSSELTALAEFCLRHDLVLCSDEIHCDLITGDKPHISIGALDSEVAERTVTLVAPSKTFNIAGLGCGFAIIPNPDLRRRFQKAARGLVPEVNVLGMAAGLAAYEECADWLASMLDYLRGNRDFLLGYADRNWPSIRMTDPEATYLSWLDCRDLRLEERPSNFFLERARVALNDGRFFGPGGEGFVRLNFGCPRSTLEKALERMTDALEGR